MPSPLCFMLSSAPLPPSAVEGRVKEVDVLLIHAILGQAQTFSEPLKMHDLAGPQELDDVVDIGVVAEPQNVIVGDAGFLLRRYLSYRSLRFTVECGQHRREGRPHR